MLKRLNISIDNACIQSLQESRYKLCIAKKFNKACNVVWQSKEQFFARNNLFSWDSQYEISFINNFAEKKIITPNTEQIRISPGQLIILDENCILGNGITNKDTLYKNEIVMINRCEFSVHPIICQSCNELLSSPVYVSPSAVFPNGFAQITPEEKILVWFQTDSEAGIMTKTIEPSFMKSFMRVASSQSQTLELASARTSSIEVDFSNNDELKIAYNSSGGWSLL